MCGHPQVVEVDGSGWLSDVEIDDGSISVHHMIYDLESLPCQFLVKVSLFCFQCDLKYVAFTVALCVLTLSPS